MWMLVVELESADVDAVVGRERMERNAAMLVKRFE